ncbi:MAG: methyltransferase, partial [Bdellovibrionales bacterium]|nr:methyltransferase [Bdellovibrionales bacterium]
GGTLGVVQHRASPKAQRNKKAEDGYVREKDLISLAKKAGFVFVAKSEVNANPKDTKNYPKGVWTLPPVLRMGDENKEKYMEIGESDRMTLKFAKPKTKS